MTLVAEGPRESRSLVAIAVDRLVFVCAAIPYALIALGLRLLMARVFFLDGQAKIDGPRVPIHVGDYVDVTIVLPAEIKASTFQLFQTQFASLPMPPTVSAYIFSYAAFVLPILLVLGFATRFAALALLALTILLQLYVAPEALWTLHAYWIAILVVLIAGGPGSISLDHVIRRISAR